MDKARSAVFFSKRETMCGLVETNKILTKTSDLPYVKTTKDHSHKIMFVDRQQKNITERSAHRKDGNACQTPISVDSSDYTFCIAFFL